MQRMQKRKRSGQRGAGLVEFAMVIPLLLLLLMGAVDFGRAFYTYIVITNAAREGARYASHFPHLADEIRDAVRLEAAGNGVALADDDISINPEPSAGPPAQSGDAIRVGVEFQFDTIMGGLIGIDNLTLRSATEMKVFGVES
jgi:hypothetical protein